MSSQKQIIDELQKLQSGATLGFALAFHIVYTRPTLLFQTYPEDWIREYSEKGLVMSDPTVHWGFEHVGTRRWSELADQDQVGVLEMAAQHDLKFGVTCAVEANDTRSMASFARADREYDDAECAELLGCITRLHDATSGMTSLPKNLVADVEKLEIRLAQPGG